ncbi:TonB-dependent siderophore receptor [Pseudoalteromonas ruthenica]|uniref:TonB-dependent siderophore receptor n=1 Tax=Pseudoalteromonas ruthenica TaxID=151081 RepID=UPI00110AE1FA|nr:TonB-dependent siderophore receptor [Pseudoalteromonas ruthenica]TMO86276.1 TonB-dependent siderophore receptor [Pseudoalteromonas ruthenica]TMP22940.1 TonB-dependent siderophore receptor [Pseudoalteromonas ruthenica]
MRYCSIFLAVISSLPALTLANTATEQDQANNDTIEKIEVVGRAFSLYRPTESSFGTRTNTPLEKIPQSIQVLPQALINDQAARQITDLYSNIAGVNAFSYSGVTFRGFRQDEILYDGVKGDPFNGFAVPQLFNIEQVAVLKGPAGAVYGSGNPGGIINYVTKKPQFSEQTTVELEVGNDDYLRGAFESTGAISDSDAHAYRVGLYRDSEEPFRANTTTDNTIVDLGYTWLATHDTELTLQYTYIEQELGGARLRGVPVDEQGNFVTDISWNHNEATDFQNVEAHVYQAIIKHDLNDTWRMDITARYFDNEELQNYHEPRGLVDTDNDGVADWSHREFRDQIRENEGFSLTANAIAELQLGDTQHQILLGSDWYKHDFAGDYRTARQQSKGGPVPGLDLHNPEYGLTSRADYNMDAIASRLSATTLTRWGVYAQDQVDLTDQWSVTAGLRYDHFEDRDELNHTEFSDSDITYRLGTSYNINDMFFPYALHGTGFVPQSASNQDPAAGGPFDPEHSRINELGLRTKLFDDSLAVNIATYDIVRENILQPSLLGDIGNDGTDDLVALGEVQSKGIELEVVGDITERWVITASYAYNDTRITESSDSIRNQIPDSDKFANAPQNTLGVWTRYELPQLNSSISAGLDYVDEQMSLGGLPVKPHTIYNMAWQTQYQNWQWQLSIKNLFDKEYASSGFITRTGHFPGEPRRIYVSAKYRF